MSRHQVWIGVLTFRRNDQLTTLLDTLTRLTGPGGSDRPEGCDVGVLVVDNDPAAGARDTVAESARRAAHTDAAPVRYVHESRPGIAAGRARAMAEASAAGADVVVFLDDDEDPHPGWLTALVRTWRETGAAAVAGRIVPDYPEGIHPLLVEGRFFERRDVPTGTRVDAAPSGNLLIDVRQVDALGLRFRTDLGLRGGEDTLFTRQLTRAGGPIVFCRESVVVDPVPADRATVRWVMRRVYAHASGEADLRARVVGAEGAERRAIRARTAVGGVARVLGGVTRLVHGIATRDGHRRLQGARTVVRGIGMTAGALASPYVEYDRSGEAPAPKES